MDELRRRVAEINWFHTIDLGHGLVTPGWDDSPSRLAREVSGSLRQIRVFR